MGDVNLLTLEPVFVDRLTLSGVFAAGNDRICGLLRIIFEFTLHSLI